MAATGFARPYRGGCKARASFMSGWIKWEKDLERDIAWCKGVVDDTSRSRLARYTACKLMAALIAERTPCRVKQMEQERGLAT